MAYRIECHVSGGVTGDRRGWLRNKDGEIADFIDKAAAQHEVERLRNCAAASYSAAQFEYNVIDTLTGERV